ncbi:MAG: Rne/Rng family ribonuclease [Planctomycetota bacterium]|nr:MAG: Rne/Rng family ribonuclease [Planctomycetota bacterium]
MLINYAPGEECRVAVVQDGRLEDLHTERASAVSHVGNIYVGKVVNVEPGIQAAFIDFGLEHNGFLHVSDLHPQYFPGEDTETTEAVGKKIPRRERPPIQRALKRGQEITVQVIKEGVGTKGPTVTSYLSIPGRFLVMMPGMDRVGVSRKIEDDEQRHAMRAILDQLDLPDGFGFILRTAGMDQTKTELKRDLAYLSRLWRDMEKRRSAGKGPRLLYAESDLLLRALRDMLSSDIKEIVIDHEAALRRANRFLKIFAPRSAPALLHYDEPRPIFHAYGIEAQIEAMHARRAPLPSGGSLVIDEAEALVAIDVNSGKTRARGDAEATALKTNKEAVDEICRQMRLRDLGGIVVLDLIDMRSRAHRREIEQRLRANLKKDPARSRALPISQFGIVELTRQRMRGSHRNVHFAPCRECDGRGYVQRPDSVASDALRHVAALFAHDRIRTVELVVSPPVAGELLSARRRAMSRLEAVSSKRLTVRISESSPIDRVTYYAYDERGADVEIDRLPKTGPAPAPKPWREAVKPGAPIEDSLEAERRAIESSEAEPVIEADVIDEPSPMLDLAEDLGDGAGGAKKRRRRRRRKKKTGGTDSGGDAGSAATPDDADEASPAAEDEPGAAGAGKKKRRRRRRRKDKGAETEPAAAEPQADEPVAAPTVNGTGQPPLRGDSWDLEPAAVTPARPSAEQDGDPASGPDASPSKKKKRATRSKAATKSKKTRTTKKTPSARKKKPARKASSRKTAPADAQPAPAE